MKQIENPIRIAQIIREIDEKCTFNNKTCSIPSKITQFLFNTTFLYARSLDKSGNPYIRQIIFVSEMDRCQIRFLTRRNSPEEKNIRNNPMISLMTQVGINSDPRMDSGLRINAKTTILDLEHDRIKIGIKLLRKYSSHLIKPEIVDLYLSKYDVIINAKIIEVESWKYNEFNRFICEQRMFPNLNPS